MVTIHMHPDFQVLAKFTTPEIKATLQPWVEEIAKLVKTTPRKFTWLQKYANEDLKSLLKTHMGSVNQASRWKSFAFNFRNKFEICGDTLCAFDTDEELSEDDEAFIPERLQLSHEETCASLRPTFAMCYYSAQGTTIRDKNVLLFDTEGHPHFTMRHLNVGLSRATHPRYVHMPDKCQQWKLLGKMEAILKTSQIRESELL